MKTYNPKILILSWLLHHANREWKDDHFYEVKNFILKKYGKLISYDVQYIEGKKCFSCGGTGIHYYYSSSGKAYDSDSCWCCYNGWYKRPTWNILKVIQFGKYTFHQPWQRVYEKPDINSPFIEGYIDHSPSKYGKRARFILFCLYEHGFIWRWYNMLGWGFALKWWLPKNYLNNIIYFHRHKKMYWNQLKDRFKPKYNYPPEMIDITDDLPF